MATLIVIILFIPGVKDYVVVRFGTDPRRLGASSRDCEIGGEPREICGFEFRHGANLVSQFGKKDCRTRLRFMGLMVRRSGTH